MHHSALSPSRYDVCALQQSLLLHMHRPYRAHFGPWPLAGPQSVPARRLKLVLRPPHPTHPPPSSQDFGEHGRELISSEIALRLLGALCTGGPALAQLAARAGVGLEQLQGQLNQTVLQVCGCWVGWKGGGVCGKWGRREVLAGVHVPACCPISAPPDRLAAKALPLTPPTPIHSHPHKHLAGPRCCPWRTCVGGSWWSAARCASARTGAAWTPTATGACTGATRRRTTIHLKSTPGPRPSGTAHFWG